MNSRDNRPLDFYRTHLRSLGCHYEDLKDDDVGPDSLGYFPSNFATEIWWDDSAECVRAAAGIGRFNGPPTAEWVNVYNAALSGGHGREDHVIAPGSITMEGASMVASADIPTRNHDELFDQLDAFGLVNRVVQTRTLQAARKFNVPFEPSDSPAW